MPDSTVRRSGDSPKSCTPAENLERRFDGVRASSDAPDGAGGRGVGQSEASVKALARQTPHEHAVPADPYKSALICAICGLPRRHAIHASHIVPPVPTVGAEAEHTPRGQR